jgi:hypothetical protein
MMNLVRKCFGTIQDEGIVVAGKKCYAHLENWGDRIFSTASYRIVQQLPIFAPFSQGSYGARAKLTLLAANETFPLLARLIRETRNNGLLEVSPVKNSCDDEASREAAAALGVLFDKYGSDKSHSHHYEYLYGSILRNPASVSGILEIGLGTNNIGVVSHMGAAGRPGSSLRAFRDFLPTAEIYGADIDTGILFEETRIRTFFVDQTDLNSFGALGKAVGKDLDLIIDDGLHSPNANLAVLIFALERLKQGGWFVAEDIPDEALPVWQVVAALMPDNYKCRLFAAGGGANLFAVQKLG